VQPHRSLPGPLGYNLIFNRLRREASWGKSLTLSEDLQIKAEARVMDEAKVVAEAGAVEKVDGDKRPTGA